MIEALVNGKLIRDTELKTSQNNKQYCNFLLSVSVGENNRIGISGIAFGVNAERMSRLGKGDAVSVVGSLKPTEWTDNATGEVRNGLNITASNVLSVYDIKKKRKSEHTKNPMPLNPNPTPFNDEILF